MVLAEVSELTEDEADAARPGVLVEEVTGDKVGIMTTAFKINARPLSFCMCVVTICLLAIIEAIDMGTAPMWAKTFLIGYSVEFPVERAIRKGKKE